MLKSIDLFTGIGGFALALKDVCRPVAYCDINVCSRSVLQDAMNTGLLPRAPVHADVYTFVPGQKVDVITAGFPCQDVSVMSVKGKGVFGKRSSVVFEVFRIAANASASVIILENSPNIKHRGLSTLVRFLKCAGYVNICWDIFTAADVGAPHERRRFYMMASKTDPKSTSVVFNLLHGLRPKLNKAVLFWDVTPSPPRVVEKTNSALTDTCKRGFLLGNSVVPACVLYASIVLSAKLFGIANARIVYETKINEFRKKKANHADYRVQMYVPKHKLLDGGQSRYVKVRWGTPLATSWWPSKIGSERASRILPNQIMYERDTLSYIRSKGVPDVDAWVINPEFIEWLMGYPRGWTRRWGAFP